MFENEGCNGVWSGLRVGDVLRAFSTPEMRYDSELHETRMGPGLPGKLPDGGAPAAAAGGGGRGGVSAESVLGVLEAEEEVLIWDNPTVARRPARARSVVAPPAEPLRSGPVSSLHSSCRFVHVSGDPSAWRLRMFGQVRAQ